MPREYYEAAEAAGRLRVRAQSGVYLPPRAPLSVGDCVLHHLHRHEPPVRQYRFLGVHKPENERCQQQLRSSVPTPHGSVRASQRAWSLSTRACVEMNRTHRCAAPQVLMTPCEVVCVTDKVVAVSVPPRPTPVLSKAPRAAACSAQEQAASSLPVVASMYCVSTPIIRR